MRVGTAAFVVLAACSGDDGGDCPPYANIVGGTFARGGATTTWTMEVEELPATLTFDKADVPSSALEYRWAIDIDADTDGDVDLQVAMLHYRMPGVAEMDKPILMGTQQDLWAVMGPTGSRIGDIDVTIAGNVITFSVDDSEDALLPMVTAASQGTWVTFVQLGGFSNQCEDEYRP